MKNKLVLATACAITAITSNAMEPIKVSRMSFTLPNGVKNTVYTFKNNGVTGQIIRKKNGAEKTYWGVNRYIPAEKTQLTKEQYKHALLELRMASQQQQSIYTPFVLTIRELQQLEELSRKRKEENRRLKAKL